MRRWLELRTAYEVARHGKVSAAANALGVHRATVSRHIDALEEDIGAKLFLRHSRGYTLTELGQEFLTVSRRADELLADFVGRARSVGRELAGEVILTVPSAISGILMSPIIRFQESNPKTRVSLIAQDRYLKLEYGEAHVALRGGPEPEEPDYVVQPFRGLRLGLYAHADYIERHGAPSDVADFQHHAFVDNPDYFKPKRANAWMAKHIPKERIVLKTSNPEATQHAVMTGAAIGLMPDYLAQSRSDLVEIIKPRQNWCAPLWLVSHVDLHRTAKVQAMLSCIKDAYPSRSVETIT
ncbi:MAG: LysR family transcriptional regulator [Pseudomonadota bacterium]